MSKHFTGFKYKGRNYMLTGTMFNTIPGFIWKPKGHKCEVIAININLPEREKQLAIHSLITGRGLISINRR